VLAWHNNGKICDLAQQISQLCGIQASGLALAHVAAGLISTFYQSNKAANGIAPKSLTFAYQLPARNDNLSRVQLLHRRALQNKASAAYQVFGLPFLLFYPKLLGEQQPITGKLFYYLVWKRSMSLLALAIATLWGGHAWWLTWCTLCPIYLLPLTVQRIIDEEKRDARFAHLFQRPIDQQHQCNSSSSADTVQQTPQATQAQVVPSNSTTTTSAAATELELQELATVDLSDFDPETLPFRLHHVTLAGQTCARCSFRKQCTGCAINSDDQALDLNTAGSNIAITWLDGADSSYYHANANVCRGCFVSRALGHCCNLLCT
jgi:hypothetical protein